MDKPIHSEVNRQQHEVIKPKHSYLQNSEERNALFSQLPLQDIPLTDEFDIPLTIESLADHEFWHHAYTANRMGLAVEEITLDRDRVTGVTKVTSAPEDFWKLQIVAAGGIAHGLASDTDIREVKKGYDQEGGLSLDEAVSEARKFIAEIDPRIRSVANKIVARMGTVSGWQMPEILERAQMEVELFGQKDEAIAEEQRAEILKKYTEYVNSVRSLNERILRDLHAPMIVTETAYEFTSDGRVKKYRVVNGQREKDFYEDICGSCGMPEGHTSECSNQQNKSEDDAKKPIQMHPDKELDIAA